MSLRTDETGQPERDGSRLRALFPFALAAGLFALGLAALYHLLEPVDLEDVLAQLRATPAGTLALAMGASFCGYLALAGYDWSALRYIGKPLPVPVVVTGGLMAYSFGNTIGLSAVSGAAVRWRIYSGLGLDGYDVAAVSTFAAVSYGVAATVVGLGALAFHPGALAGLLPLAEDVVRLAAIAGIAGIAVPLVVASARGASLRIWRFNLRAPSIPVLAGQVLFSLGDITFSAVALYILLPETGLDFLAFLAIFAAATMAGIASHVPGGVGVFETVIIAAMPAGTPIEGVAAALLLFRLVYYLIPFALAVAVLALHEVALAAGLRPRGALARALAATDPAFRAAEPLVPLLLSVLIFASGLWMTFAALVPVSSEAAQVMEELFPLAFVEGRALLSSALGAGLIVLALGVARRSQGAFLLSMGAIAAAALIALSQGPDLRRAAVLAAVFLVLAAFRRSFHRRTMLTDAALTPGWMALVLCTVLAMGFVLFLAYRGTPYAHEQWWEFAADARAPRALRAGLVASLAVGLGALILLLRRAPLKPHPPTQDELARAEAIVAAAPRPEAALALTGDKNLVFSDAGDGFLMFGRSGGSWIALGAPVGAPEARADLAVTFTDAARRNGARPVFHELREGDLPLMVSLGLSLYRIGDEAVVDLRRFNLDGPERRKLRAARSGALRDGLTLDLLQPPHDPALFEQLRQVSDAWRAARRRPEKSFCVGRFDPDWLNRWPVAVVRRDGRVIAFANVITTGNGEEAALDLMRRSPDAPSSVTGFLFTELILRMKELGYRRLSLGIAPLAGLDPRRSRRLWDRYGAALYRHGGSFRDFAGLRGFKAGFGPEWRPRYLAAPASRRPLLALADVAALIAGGTEDTGPAKGGQGRDA